MMRVNQAVIILRMNLGYLKLSANRLHQAVQTQMKVNYQSNKHEVIKVLQVLQFVAKCIQKLRLMLQHLELVDLPREGSKLRDMQIIILKPVVRLEIDKHINHHHQNQTQDQIASQLAWM